MRFDGFVYTSHYYNIHLLPSFVSRLIRFNYHIHGIYDVRTTLGGDLYFKQRKLLKTKCDYANYSYVKLKLEIRAFKNNVTVVA